MKKQLFISTILFCIGFSTLVNAQKNSNKITIQTHTLSADKEAIKKQKNIELQQKNSSQNSTISAQDNSPLDTKIGKVVAGSKEYNDLKVQGLINRYEITVDASKNTPISKTQLGGSMGLKTLANTPCDYPVIQGVQPWGTTLTDDATTIIALPFSFCFYGVNYTSCRVGTNGNIQFGTSNSTAFSSLGFPSTTVKMIAPFWSDLHVNVTSGGLLYGKVYVDVYPTRMIVSWDSSAYFNQKTDKLNSFQCVITDGLDPILPPGKNVGFYYKKMEWTTGDASSGIGGFPNPLVTPAIPATVGANEGNGTDYFLIGRFGVPGAAYDGPLGANDGVSWLNNKKFFLNVCPPVGANQEPVSTLIGYCDTLKVCGNDTLYIKNTFIAPEITQSSTITATAPTLGSSFTYSQVTTGNSSDIYMIVNGSTASAGYHTVTMSATDNGTPAQTSVQTFEVFINQLGVNNLNGNIVVTPTLGACPGGVVTASLILSGGAPDTYLWSNNQVTPSSTFTTVVPSDSLIFVTIQSGQCKKTILGDININPVPVASITGNLIYCNGGNQGTILTGTNTNNPSLQGPHTYTWSGPGIVGSVNTPTISAVGGQYTVTVANQFGCLSQATTSVTVNDSPSYTVSTNATTNGTVYCASLDSARLALNYGVGLSSTCGLATSGCAVSNTINVGSGTTTSNATATSPFANLWGNTRHQYLFTAAELISSGVSAGKISSIAFNITAVSGLTNYPNFQVKLKCTTATAMTSTPDNTGLTTVYQANTPITVGLNTLNFTTPYLWNGTDNLLIDVCHNDSPWTNSSTVRYTTTGFVSVHYDFDDGTQLCGSTALGNTSSNRPNIVFGNCLANQLPSQFDVVVTPTLGVTIPAAKDSIKIDLPPTNTVVIYTITVTNPIGGCATTQTVALFVPSNQATITPSASNSVICEGQSVTLTAMGATSYTWSYSTPTQTIASGNSIFVTPPQVGANTYIVSGNYDCAGSAPGTNTVIVMVVPKANLIIAPLQDVTKCLNKNYTITTGVGSTTSGNAGTPYSYVWTVLPSGAPAPGANTNSSYVTSSNGTTTLAVTVNGACANSASTTVVIKNYTDDLALTIANSATVCANSELTLNTITSGGKPNYTYNWNWSMLFNSASISNQQNLTINAPSVEGTYTVAVTVIDSCDYNETAFQVFTVLPPCNIVIPNVMSVNNDGINDVFIVQNIEHHPNTRLSIFDRWGKKIYENANYNNEWRAEGVSDGTFFYVIDVPDDKSYNGFITIFHGK